jgi:hypothetical protein
MLPSPASATGWIGYGWPVWPTYPFSYFSPPYPPYLVPDPCYPYGTCTSLLREERLQRRRPLAPGESAPAGPDIWGNTGSPWGYVRRLPPPTPESQIQPRYRDSGTIRPEYAGGGADSAPR